MPINLPQTPVGVSSVAAGSTLTPALGTTATAGNVLVVCAGGFVTVISITGAGVTTWTKIIDFPTADANHDFGEIWCGLVDGTPGTTPTVTFSASGQYRSAHLIELSGAQKATNTTVAFGNDTAGTSDSKNITPTADGCIIISVLSAFQGNPPGATTPPTGYTALTHLDNSPTPTATFDTAYLIQTAQGSSTMNWTALHTGTFPALGAVAILPASSVPNVTLPVPFGARRVSFLSPGARTRQDSIIGEPTQQRAHPSFDNAVSTWTRGGVDSGTLYGQVSENAPGDDADYITSVSA